ncbi:DUF2263-containing protein [Aureococcus anophagefferens]|nr:DUF2263-containing protein [Aureococcus anophagefferens]
MALGRRLSSGDVPAPTNWRARAQHRRRYGLIWATVVIIVSSYFGSLVVVRAFDSDDVDCSDTCADAPLNETGTVLMIGDRRRDSILKGYYDIVAGMLNPGDQCLEKGVAKRGVLAKTVYGRFGSGNGYCGTSYGVNQCLDRYFATTTNNFSVAGQPTNQSVGENIYAPMTFDEYEANMDLMYRKLRNSLSPNGTMIFATTTPVPPSYDAEKRVNSDVVELNARARKLFGPTGKYADVRINDLYSNLVEICNNDPATRGYPETSDCALIQDDGVRPPAGQRLNAIAVAAHAALLVALGALAGRAPTARRYAADDEAPAAPDGAEDAAPRTPRSQPHSPFHGRKELAINFNPGGDRARFAAGDHGARPRNGSGSRLVDDDGRANAGSPDPADLVHPCSPFSPDERRSDPIYPQCAIDELRRPELSESSRRIFERTL